MDKKEATRLLANREIAYEAASRRTVGEQHTARNEAGRVPRYNDKEDAIIDAIDQKAFLEKHAKWIEDLREGRIDVPGFISGTSPEAAIELARMALSEASPKVRLAAITDLLDRAGYSKVNKVAAAIVDPNAPKAQLLAMLEGLNRKTQVIEIMDDDDDPEDPPPAA